MKISQLFSEYGLRNGKVLLSTSISVIDLFTNLHKSIDWKFEDIKSIFNFGRICITFDLLTINFSLEF